MKYSLKKSYISIGIYVLAYKSVESTESTMKMLCVTPVVISIYSDNDISVSYHLLIETIDIND